MDTIANHSGFTSLLLWRTKGTRFIPKCVNAGLGHLVPYFVKTQRRSVQYPDLHYLLRYGYWREVLALMHRVRRHDTIYQLAVLHGLHKLLKVRPVPGNIKFRGHPDIRRLLSTHWHAWRAPPKRFVDIRRACLAQWWQMTTGHHEREVPTRFNMRFLGLPQNAMEATMFRHCIDEWKGIYVIERALKYRLFCARWEDVLMIAHFHIRDRHLHTKCRSKKFLRLAFIVDWLIEHRYLEHASNILNSLLQFDQVVQYLLFYKAWLRFDAEGKLDVPYSTAVVCELLQPERRAQLQGVICHALQTEYMVHKRGLELLPLVVELFSKPEMQKGALVDKLNRCPLWLLALHDMPWFDGACDRWTKSRVKRIMQNRDEIRQLPAFLTQETESP